MKKVLFMKSLLCFLLLLLGASGFSQNASISGRLVTSNGTPLSFVNIRLEPNNISVQSNTNGAFTFSNLTAGDYTVVHGDHSGEQIVVSLAANEQKDLGDLVTQESVSTLLTENIFSELDVVDNNDESGAVSGMLTASQDVFLNKAGYQFGSDVFFRVRGYDTQYTDFMINGVRLENPENGWQPFSIVGGLNDVLRYNDIRTVGLNALENGQGEIGGAIDYTLRPSRQGRGGRLTYSNLNRAYRNRIMAHYASGDQNGLSYVVSGSRRWAKEGNVEGTFYDSWAGYAALEGKVSDKYSVAASFLTSPRRRGTNSIHRQEAYDLTGTNYYNADWGWQDGEKRNSRIRRNSNPVIMFSNYLNVGENTKLQLTGAYIFGYNAQTRIDRQNAANPDPDYYRRFTDGNFLYNPQLDWDLMYRVNQNDSDDNDAYLGTRANYIQQNNKRDDQEYQIVLRGDSKLKNEINLTYGGNFKKYNGRYYAVIEDLLGADYWLNIDSFNDNISNFAGELDTRKYVNDVYGYDYDLNNRSFDGYVQADYSLDQWDFFLGGSLGNTTYWRHGNVASGAFETNSKGDGEHKNFFIYSAKGGATYKLDGRNYFSANGMYYTKPPLMQVAFTRARTADGFYPFLKKQTVYGGEVNYNHKSPKVKVRATGYMTRFNDQASAGLTFLDAGAQEGFGTNFVTGIDKLHYGGEFGGEYKINPDWTLSGAAAIGKYTYMSRPITSLVGDTQEQPIFNPESSYLLDFYESNTPQTALNMGLTYQAPFRMIVNVDANYYDHAYVGPSAIFRTQTIASQLVQQPGLNENENIKYWTKQQALPSAFRLNFSLYKNFRINYDKSIGVNFSMNNLLNDEDYSTLAFEDLRTGFNQQDKIDPTLFPARYRYALGRTYFLNVNYKFR